MNDTLANIAALDWQTTRDHIHESGYVLLPGILPGDECRNLIAGFDDTLGFRKTVIMERHRYGQGEYKYYSYPLPDIVDRLRSAIYPQLAPLANNWMDMLSLDQRYPSGFTEFQMLCHAQEQKLPTALILKYGPGGFNTLHQDLYGDIFFPLQAALFLNEPEADYTGGEFVLTQQNPRAQSEAIVLQPRKGDMLIFATSFRPAPGSRGYHRLNMKHGVSRVHSGERHTLGIIFHDAKS